MPTERDLERACRRKAQKHDLIWLKIQASRGMPDRLLVSGRYYIWIELKTRRGRLSPMQVWTHKKLRAIGADIRIIRSTDEFDKLLEELGCC